MSKGAKWQLGTWALFRAVAREPEVTVAHRTRGLGVVERVPKTTPKGVVFCRHFTDTSDLYGKFCSLSLSGQDGSDNTLPRGVGSPESEHP